MDIKQRIDEIRDSHIPKKRVKERARFENKARELIFSKMSALSWYSVKEIISLIDSDVWEDEVYARFSPLFCLPNLNKIKTNNISLFNKYLNNIFEKEDTGKIDTLIDDLSGISYGATSVFFYVKDPSKYNVFLNATLNGLKTVYPEEAKDIAFERPFDGNYELFNKLCNRMKNEYSLDPQELDIVLTVLGKQNRIKEKKEEEPKTSSMRVGNEQVIASNITNHADAEAILLELGNLLGYQTYTADPSKISNSVKLGSLATAKDVPAALRSAKGVERVDVIWYYEDMPPNYFFEVEDGGTMREALHRLYQARHLYAKFFVIGPENNREKFEKYISTNPFNASRKQYNFRTYEELSKLFKFTKDAEKFKMYFGII